MIADSLNITIPYALPDSLAAADTVDVDTASYILLSNDSVFSCYDTLMPIAHSSLFATSIVSQKEPVPVPHTPAHSLNWTFGATIILLAIISIFLNSRKFKMKDLALSLFDIRTLDRVFRENNIKAPTLIPMAAIYYFALSLLVILPLYEGNLLMGSLPHPLLFIILYAIAMVIFFLKNGFLNLLGIIFDSRESTKLYISNNYLFDLAAGIVVAPLLLPAYFGGAAAKPFLVICIIIVSIFFIVRILRGLQLILTNSQTSQLYLFYYLCILEIAPILIIGKLLFL